METVQVNDHLLYEQIGKRIREIRESQSDKLTQAKLGEFVGLERSSISNIEKGIQRMPMHVFFGLCASLHVDPSDVLPSIADVVTDTNMKTVQVGNMSHVVSRKVAQLINASAS